VIQVVRGLDTWLGILFTDPCETVSRSRLKLIFFAEYFKV